MSTFSRDVWNYIAANPGQRASQIIVGVRKQHPTLSKNYARAVLNKLKQYGFLTASEHPDSIPTRLVNAYEVANLYDEELYRKGEKELLTTYRPFKKYLPEPVQPPQPSKVELVVHTFLIRPGCTIKIELPIDVTSAETQRLALFAQSLVFK